MRPVGFLLAIASTACATATATAPTVRTFQLGRSRAEYRDYRSGDICSAEPRWLVEELRAPLSIIGRFASLAGADADGAWTADDLAFLSQGATTLPPVLDVVEANLTLVRKCSSASRPDLAEVLRDGPERCAAARRALPDIPRLVEYVAARSAREAWRKDRVARSAEALTTCGHAAPEGPPVVCLSVLACDGSQEWLFTDGARVSRAAGKGSFDLLPGPPVQTATKGGKRPPAPLTLDDYVAATTTFVGADRCPPFPERPPPHAARTGALAGAPDAPRR